MKKWFFIFLVFFSCSTEKLTNSSINQLIVEGCTDPESRSYNRSATQDDGSCKYLSYLELFLKNYSKKNNTVDIIMFNSGDVNYELLGGIQFSLAGASIINAFGGIVEENNFMTSSSSETVISFSLSGESIKLNKLPQKLMTLSMDDIVGPICLKDIYASSPTGIKMNINFKNSSCLSSSK